MNFFIYKVKDLAGKPAGSIELGKIRGPLFQQNEYLTDTQLNHHVHIVGASGYGKTVLISKIIKEKIMTNKGLLFLDLKGDLEMLRELTKYLSQAGRLDDLQVFSLSHENLSQNYNPLQDGSATQLRDRIMTSFNWSEEFYKNQASSFLLKLLIGFCYIRLQAKKQFGFGEILKAVSDKSYIENLILEIKEVCHEKVMLEDCYQFLRDAGNFNSLQGLRTQLESLVYSDFGKKLSTFGDEKQGEQSWNNINLFSSIQNKKILFFFLDTRRYGESAKAVGRFILQDLKATSAKIDAEIPVGSRHPFTIVIDEFADLAQEDFISFLDRARSSKIALVIAHQELSDLQRISPEFMSRLTGNTSTLYAFLQKNPKSAEMISGMAGTRTVWKTTRQTERMWFFEVESGNGSKREVEEFNIHPNLVKSLKVGECVCIKKYPESRSYLVKVKRE